MALLIAIGGLTAGVIIGVIATYRFSNTSPVKVRQLEQQIEDLQQTHKAYRENVSNHFNTTAELIQQMTESYRDVYRHLASGAQSLCDHEVADKMLPAGERDRLFREEPATDDDAAAADADTDAADSRTVPPRDYAESSGGALSEDYGLGKPAQQSAQETDPATAGRAAGSREESSAGTAESAEPATGNVNRSADDTAQKTSRDEQTGTAARSGTAGNAPDPDETRRGPESTEPVTGPADEDATVNVNAGTGDQDKDNLRKG